MSPSPFYTLQDMLTIYANEASMYGRPYYPTLETFGGWVDNNQDTLGNITVCGNQSQCVIDEHCFGQGPIHSSNDFDVVKAESVTGMWPEKAMLNLPTGEPIFPSGGMAVYQMGHGVMSIRKRRFRLLLYRLFMRETARHGSWVAKQHNDAGIFDFPL